jgi:dTDP-4-dehydrorhamnose 3,5-epimerase-like enzyme
MIDGVVFKNLQTFTDERGFFREILREGDPNDDPEIGYDWSVWPEIS